MSTETALALKETAIVLPLAVGLVFLSFRLGTLRRRIDDVEEHAARCIAEQVKKQWNEWQQEAQRQHGKS